MAADADVGDAEGEGEVDQQQDPELRRHVAQATGPGDQEGRAEDPEDRARRADGDLPGSVSATTPNAPARREAK